MTRSAISTVDSRWAMMIAVRSARIVRRARCTRRSLGMSSDDVASSRISTAGSARNARANATSCRWPADSRPPRLPTIGVVPLGQRRDEVMGSDRSCRCLHLVVTGRWTPEADVVRDGVGEEEVLLGDHDDGPSQVLLGQVSDVDAVEPHGALDGVVEAGNQPRDGRLAGTRGTDQRQRLPCGNVQVEVGQDVDLAVGEGHVVEVELSP